MSEQRLANCYLCHREVTADTCGGWVTFIYASFPVCQACTEEGA